MPWLEHARERRTRSRVARGTDELRTCKTTLATGEGEDERAVYVWP